MSHYAYLRSGTQPRISTGPLRSILLLLAVGTAAVGSLVAITSAQDRSTSRGPRPTQAFEYATFTLLDRGARLVTERGVQTIDPPTLVDTSKIRESTDQGIFVRQTSLPHVYMNILGRSGWQLPQTTREPQIGEEVPVRRQIERP